MSGTSGTAELKLKAPWIKIAYVADNDLFILPGIEIDNGDSKEIIVYYF